MPAGNGSVPPGKRSRFLSGQTVYRSKPPANPKTAQKIPCFQWDYSKPMNVLPDEDRDNIVEDSPQRIMGNYGPVNRREPLRLRSDTGADDPPSGKLFLSGQGSRAALQSRKRGRNT